MAESEKNLRTHYTKGRQSIDKTTDGTTSHLTQQQKTQQVASEVDTGEAAADSQTLVVPDDCAGMRFDQVLVKLLPEYSRSRLQEWIVAGQASLNGALATAKQKVWGGEAIVVQPQAHPAEQPYLAEDIALDVVYEDESLLVINKPAGLVVHPGSGNWEGTLLNALLHHAPQLEGVPRAGIVHRLDKDVSGLMIIPLNQDAFEYYKEQFKQKLIKKGLV